jgi:hypothetical protein
MRLTEFTSAEDTLTLWKMISDNTWAAIAQQAEAEAKRKAERAAARKSASKRGIGKSTAKPVPPKRLPPPLQHVSAPVAKDAKPANEPSTKTPPLQQSKAELGKQATQQMGGGIKQQQAKAANSQQASALPTQQKAVGLTQPQPSATTPQAAQVKQPQATQLPLTPQQQRVQRQNVGVVVKNAAATKRV